MRLPMWLLQEMIAAMPSIEAREALQAVRVATIGSGSLKPSQSRRLLEEWRGEIRVATPQPRRQMTGRETIQAARARGLTVVVGSDPGGP